jgi:hypothetical protein
MSGSASKSARFFLSSATSRSLATGGRLRDEEAVPLYTPVYYKHGLPGSYNEIWGFELMWQRMEDLHDRRARSLYYHNLVCNVPVYLHTDLRDDNEHCVVLWWYASTCRQPGMGGTLSAQLAYDMLRQLLVDFAVSRDRLRRFQRGVRVPVVPPTMSRKYAAEF